MSDQDGLTAKQVEQIRTIIREENNRSFREIGLLIENGGLREVQADFAHLRYMRQVRYRTRRQWKYTMFGVAGTMIAAALLWVVQELARVISAILDSVSQMPPPGSP